MGHVDTSSNQNSSKFYISTYNIEVNIQPNVMSSQFYFGETVIADNASIYQINIDKNKV